ncbi:9991_t:CDS:2 [Funneliformis geosporum]|uniref:9991_t:CDS:1 n=1 Tax=Funneliformis geosporum TaxID=1117311 RepID=A0A9W4T7A5_9GLOM|nr:9991_t:CDS:2 [Funneliformis geosporum]
MDPNDLSNLDNNALFYGAPRTGKSVMAEKLAYEANIYPLVVIQGSSLTPNKPQKDNGVDPLIKFIFTISSITYDLADDYGFERAEDGEIRYILFLDEADQACTTNSLPPSQASTELTFLKEYSINMAIYQAGRLSNPLSFNEDNQLYDSKQLENFEGEFINPRKTEIEEILTGVEKNIISSANQISKTIDTRLNELKQKTEEIRFEIVGWEAKEETEALDSPAQMPTLINN